MSHRVQMRCDDYDVIGAVPRDLSVIKNFLKGDCAVKRLIDIEEEIIRETEARNEESKPPVQPQPRQKRKSNGNGKANGNVAKDPCESLTPPEDKMPNYCDPCGQLKTSLVLEELTTPALTNPALNKPSYSYFDEETVMGSALPVKYRFRRNCKNNDYDKPMNLMSNPTDNTNVVVLTNCCDLLVWPSQRVQQMNRVPVTMISGSGDLTEYMLEEETVM
uniref:GK21399 n=1 Tax=Drosophila willistoni TaxID=7260 RepID=B4MQN0_DROWI